MTTDNTEKKLEIWTDGASKGNPGIGGWGAYLVWGAHTKEIFGARRTSPTTRWNSRPSSKP